MIRTTVEDGTFRVSPEGNIGVDETETLQKALETALASETPIVVDLAKCRSISSSAIGALIACHNALRSRGAKLQIRGAGDDMRKLLKLMGLDRHFEVA